MSPAPVIRPNLRLSFLQRTVRHLPLARRAFWVPAACYADVHELAAASSGEVVIKELMALNAEASPAEACREPRFVALLNQGKVVGDCLLAASKTDEVAGRLQALHGAEKPGEHWVLRRCRYRREISLSGTSALLAAASGANYYHWLLESLPRLLLLKQAGFALNAIDRFLVNQEQHPFHAQTLEILGIPNAKRVSAQKNRVFRCECLLVPSLPAEPMVFPSWTITFLREQFLAAAASIPMERIFISRRRAGRRRLLNESEIEEHLRMAGFRTVILEDLSFREQVGMFASASAIIAPHGAGLSNLVFAKPGTKVIELVGPTFINHCFQKLARAMLLPYAEIVGNLTNTPRKRVEEDDFVVPEVKLRESMERLGF